MFKINSILIIIIIILLTIINSRESLIDDYLDDFDIKYEEHLKRFYYNYLDKNNLLESDEIIKEDEIKKIIVDIMLEGISPDEIEESILLMYKDLSDIYYEKKNLGKKEIKGKDLFNEINIKDLMQQYYELNGESPKYDDDYIFNDDNLFFEKDDNDFDL